MNNKVKKYKHKTTGEEITYVDGVIKSGFFTLEIGCEPSSKYWQEVEEPFFITEDGKQIFKGDKFYEANLFCGEVLEYSLEKPVHFSKDILKKLFSTKEAAEEYIILNKPCLSLKEVGQFYNKLLDFSNGNSKGLRELVKKKLSI